MFVGRFLMIVPMLAIAGSLGAKKIVPVSVGTFPTDGGLFVGLVVGVILINRRPDLPAFPRPGPGRRTTFDARRHNFLRHKPMQSRDAKSSLLDPAILLPAIGQSVTKLNPRQMIRNPVMFVVEIVAALTTVIFLRDLLTGGANLGFTGQIIFWLWLTVVFANFAEAVAEGRGKAQAASLRKARTDTMANRIIATGTEQVAAPT